jgi:hypothetical protein
MSEHKRVLIIGEDPSLVDFSDPAIPPDMNAEKVLTGLRDSVAQLRGRGREADLLLTTGANAAANEVRKALAAKAYDVVVVGAGLRVVPKMTPLFEAVMNAVHERAPGSKLAFNLAPEDSAAAAERQLG